MASLPAMGDVPAIVNLPATEVLAAMGDVPAIGRMATTANQMGMPQASEPLTEVSKGVVGMAGLFGGEVGGPVTDGMQGLADEVCAWIGSGNVVHTGTRSLPASSVNSLHPNGSYNPYAVSQSWNQNEFGNDSSF
eukprot:gene19811-26493_t